MKFGGFYEHQLPRPWASDSEHTLLKNALEQAVLSDQSGYDYVWATEHHFLEEYAHSSAPEVFLAAVSQRTKNIRIGHGIVQTPPHINHPARIAERIATLDLLSDGRVEFGTGAGATETELGGFLVPQAEKKNMQLEGMRVAVRMLVEDPFTGYRRPVRESAATQRGSQALTEAASAVVDGVFAPRVDSASREAGHGRADVFLRRRRRRRASG